MNTYKVTLRTSEYRHIEVQAESEEDVRFQLGSLSANEVEELTDGIAYEYADEYDVDIIEKV